MKNAWISNFKLLLTKHNVCFVPGLRHLSPSLSPMVCFWHELMLWDGDGGVMELLELSEPLCTCHWHALG